MTIMESIKAHILNSQLEAEHAIQTINSGEGIPISPTATTRTYCTFEVYEGIFYIRADETTEKYLGVPRDLEILTTFSV